jgi:hypothetical protein
MAELSQSVQAHLDEVTPEKRRRDAQTLLELMGRVTGKSPQLWRGMIGFGQYHYKYPSGREGDAPAAGFAHLGKRRPRSISPMALADTRSSSNSWGRTPLEWDASTSRIWTRSTSPSSKPSLLSRTGRCRQAHTAFALGKAELSLVAQ